MRSCFKGRGIADLLRVPRVVPLALGVHAGDRASMRLLAASLLALAFGGTAVGACSLNPQPLPPDTNDGSIDGATMGLVDSGGGSDAAVDVMSVPDNDASDAAGADAETDASDAGASDSGDVDADTTFDARPE